MNFSGNLKQQPFAEILIKIAESKWTGLLSFKSRQKKVEIDWVNGNIVHIVQRPAPSSGNLGDMLVEIGEISANQLSQALVQQRRSLSPLGQILIKLFRISPSLVRQVLRVQAIETLYEMFSWTSGDFDFKIGLVDRKGNNIDPINVNVFLSEAIPALDVWAEVVQAIPTPQHQIQSVGESLPHDGIFNKNDHKVFDAIQQKERTFRELSIVTGLGQFVVGGCLLKLLEERLIYLREPECSRFAWTRLVLGGSALDFAVWVLAMTLLVGAGTYLLAFAPYSPLRMIQPRHQYRIADPRWSQHLHQWRYKRIRQALEIYRLQHGYYPANLQVLQKSGWIPEVMLKDPEGKLYSYRRRNTLQYRLGPPAGK